MERDQSSLLPKSTGTIHYGSLKVKTQEDELIQAGIEAGNINISKGDTTDIEEHHDSKNELLEMFEKRKRARLINISTDDSRVKAQLRELREPICLFGEDAGDRRERLRLFISLMNEGGIAWKPMASAKTSEVPDAHKEPENVTWYHEGTDLLKQARLDIAIYSLPRARDRLQEQREEELIPTMKISSRLQETFKVIQSINVVGSQIADIRPISYCNFSNDGKYLATSSWSGTCKVWSIPDCKEVHKLNGYNIEITDTPVPLKCVFVSETDLISHSTNCGCIKFHPQVDFDDKEGIAMATCSHDGCVRLWSMNSCEPLADIQNHNDKRVSRLSFHPSGRYLGTCCFDNSWRLFDLVACEEILHQEGHSKSVYDIDFQNDGALAVTAGLDGYGRVWDLRTGRCIMFMEGHLKGLLSAKFSFNGYQIVTGSEDHTMKVWDLRQQCSIYTIPAHNSIVSNLQFQDESLGGHLISCSYDGVAKIWSKTNWAPLKSLEGHSSKLTCVDTTKQGLIATCSFDRTFKLWQPDIE